ncbi:hypothetical protein D3C79_720760 [compost metagenome]
MRSIARNLSSSTGAAPVVHQASGRNSQALAQALVVSKIELLVEKNALQLRIKLLEERASGIEECRAVQPATTTEFTLVQLFDTAQSTVNLS